MALLQINYLCNVKNKLNPLNEANMNKFYTSIAMTMIALLTFTSCEPIEILDDMEDRHEARTLDGTWSGYIDTYYVDRWGLTGDSYRTTMYFERENAYGGWGYEVDYDLYSRYSDYYYCEFRWEVYGGTIRISYDDSWNDVYISNYSLTDNYFKGTMNDGTSTDILFNLAYDSRFDWSYWQGGHTRGGNDGTTVKASGKFLSK